MKLRNKKTGAIVEAYKEEPIDLFFYLGTDGEGDELNRKTYHSLAELNAEWEDAEDINVPNIPLIKDEKIRKAVRAWAEACGAKQIKYSIAPNQYYDADIGLGFAIKFLTKPVEVYLEEGKTYTITELCGEEEE